MKDPVALAVNISPGAAAGFFVRPRRTQNDCVGERLTRYSSVLSRRAVLVRTSSLAPRIVPLASQAFPRQID